MNKEEKHKANARLAYKTASSKVETRSFFLRCFTPLGHKQESYWRNEFDCMIPEYVHNYNLEKERS
jgi:hypothetical protein